MNSATTAKDEYPVTKEWTDPETGYRWIHLGITAPFEYDQVKALPKVLKYDNDTFVRTGWNSDVGEVYYRNHMPTAKGA